MNNSFLCPLFVLCAALLCFTPAGAVSTEDLYRTLCKAVSDKPAKIGVAVVIDHQDTVCVNNDARYPFY